MHFLQSLKNVIAEKFFFPGSRDDLSTRVSSRFADVYFNDQTVIVAARHYVDRVLGGPGEPCTKYAISCSAQDLGASAMIALSGSRHDLTEDELNDEVKKVFALAGVRSWNALERKWWCILIYEIPDDPEKRLKIVPTKKYSTGGYLFVDEAATHVVSADAVSLGEVLRRLIDELDQSVVPADD